MTSTENGLNARSLPHTDIQQIATTTTNSTNERKMSVHFSKAKVEDETKTAQKVMKEFSRRILKG